MTYLSDKFEQGQSLLGKPKPVAVEVDAIKQDTFDHEVYRSLLDEAPALSDLAYEDLGKTYDYTETLVGDIVMSFWKGDPQLREIKEMHPSHLLNRAVAGDINEAPETVQTRMFTQHDKYGAAMATIAVTDKIKDSLDKAKEAQEAAEAAAEAQKELMDALRDLMQAMGAMAGAMGAPGEGDEDGEGIAISGMAGGEGQEGPMTEGQAQAYEDLVAAIERMQQAEMSAETTLEEAQSEAASVQAALRAPIREAIQEVGDMLAEEADMFSSWGLEDGEMKKLSFEERQRLARALKQNRLNAFRKLIGRFRMMAAAQRARKVEYARDEAFSVEMSDRLEDVLSSEYGRLGNRHARLQFLSDLSEGQLLSKKYRGIEQLGQGAIIALVDNSGSMTAVAGRPDPGQPHLTRESYAKAFALALLDQARAAGRDFVGINFSSPGQVSVFRFPKGQSTIQQVLAFVEEFWNGGTDYMRPLDLAMDILEAEFNDAGKMKGDLVLITDDDCRVTPEWMKGYLARKEKLDFRVFGIAVGIGYGNALDSLCDNVRSVMDFADPNQVADIIRTV